MLVLLNRELIIKVLNYLLQILKLCLLLFHHCTCSWGIVFHSLFYCLWYVMLILA